MKDLMRINVVKLIVVKIQFRKKKSFLGHPVYWVKITISWNSCGHIEALWTLRSPKTGLIHALDTLHNGNPTVYELKRYMIKN